MPLTRRHVALVDDEDYALVSRHKWSAVHQGQTFRASTWVREVAGGPRKAVLMHRLILGITDSKVKVDHRDGDALNNRRANIRACTATANNRNARKRQGRSTSRFKGVVWAKHASRWRAIITVNNRTVHLGYLAEEIEAALAYDKSARKHFKQFAKPNFAREVQCA
jgi:hypothetical protein